MCVNERAGSKVGAFGVITEWIYNERRPNQLLKAFAMNDTPINIKLRRVTWISPIQNVDKSKYLRNRKMFLFAIYSLKLLLPAPRPHYSRINQSIPRATFPLPFPGD